jgi:GMP reductase
MKIETDTKLDFNNVLIRPKRSTVNSRTEVNLNRQFKFKYSTEKWDGVPIISANMDTTGTFEVYDVLSKYNIITALNKFYTLDDYNNYTQNFTLDSNLFMVSTGISDSDFANLNNIMESKHINCKWICIDIANGYISKFASFCRKVRDKYPNKIIVAGNVVTRELTEELILTGMVDVVKVGIGSGSACLTRLKTGIGMPQLSAVMECADAAHGVNGHIISDGGITCPGDMVKAFGGGADFVMCGSVFAGHDENPGELIVNKVTGEKTKLYYGMSSEHAMKKNYGEMKDYKASEGRVVKMKYKGALENTLLDYLGGMRSACAYINATCVKDISKCTTFVKVTQQLNVSLV